MKNPFLAAVLGFVLGPIGLIYVSFGHAAMAFIVILVLGMVTGGVAALPAWIGCAFVGYNGANKINADLAAAAGKASSPPPDFTAAPLVTSAPTPGESGKFCSACGQRLALTSRFCNKCGAAAAA